LRADVVGYVFARQFHFASHSEFLSLVGLSVLGLLKPYG